MDEKKTTKFRGKLPRSSLAENNVQRLPPSRPCTSFLLVVHYIPLLDIFSEADQHEKSTRDGQDGQGIEDQQ